MMIRRVPSRCLIIRLGSEPDGGVFKNMQNRFNFVDSVLLIAWPEIKHRPLAKLPERTSTEVLASFPGFVEDDFVRGGHMERFIVHLRFRNGEC